MFTQPIHLALFTIVTKQVWLLHQLNDAEAWELLSSLTTPMCLSVRLLFLLRRSLSLIIASKPFYHQFEIPFNWFCLTVLGIFTKWSPQTHSQTCPKYRTIQSIHIDVMLRNTELWWLVYTLHCFRHKVHQARQCLSNWGCKFIKYLRRVSTGSVHVFRCLILVTQVRVALLSTRPCSTTICMDMCIFDCILYPGIIRTGSVVPVYRCSTYCLWESTRNRNLQRCLLV